MANFDTLSQQIVAHRGLSSLYPENTLNSFKAAIEAGFTSIEVDVKFTKDFKLVAHHDDSINRTSNRNGKLSDYTLSDLKLVNFNYPKKFGDEHEFCEIPTLREIFRIATEHNIELVLDLKEFANLERLNELIDEQEVNKKMISFLIYSPYQAKTIRSSNKISSVYNVVFKSSSINDFFLAYLMSNGINGIALDNSYRESENIMLINKMGLDIIIWNISSPKNLNPYIRLNDRTKILVDKKLDFKSSMTPEQVAFRNVEGAKGQLTYLNLGEVYFSNPNSEPIVNINLITVDGKKVSTHYVSRTGVIYFDKNVSQTLILMVETRENIYSLKFSGL